MGRLAQRAEEEAPGTSLRPQHKLRCHLPSCLHPPRPSSIADEVNLKHKLSVYSLPLLKALNGSLLLLS